MKTTKSFKIKSSIVTPIVLILAVVMCGIFNYVDIKSVSEQSTQESQPIAINPEIQPIPETESKSNFRILALPTIVGQENNKDIFGPIKVESAAATQPVEQPAPVSTPEPAPQPVQEPIPEPVLEPQPVEVNEQQTHIEEEEARLVESDRTKPIYNVYKDGYFISAATAEIQWMIRDLVNRYNLPAEKYIYGMIVLESTFNPSACSSSGCKGLCQISSFWINGAAITHFTDDYRNRNLYNPYDNLLTLAEMWSYAINAYGIDVSTEQGVKDLLYWHNTGSYRRGVSWGYSNQVVRYANELQPAGTN